MPLMEKTSKLGAYDANEIETRRYRWWMEQGYFKPSQGDSSYAIVMPPPNVTGILHLGHAMDMAVVSRFIFTKKCISFLFSAPRARSVQTNTDEPWRIDVLRFISVQEKRIVE
ncbi:hypothetical protein AYJ22_10130 [Ferroacidibacillus organovorans]|nr:hypothetical protein AYJ22_10130 [Ferroacidibacillus organovorans]